MSWLTLLLLTVPLAIGLERYHPYWWVPRDRDKIAADGAGQRLTNVFHRQRTIWRGVIVLVLSVGGASPLALAGYWSSFCWAAAALFVVGVAFFWRFFTPALNLSRLLDYVGEWHVSWAVGASLLDRILWRNAWVMCAPYEVPWPDGATPLHRFLWRVCWPWSWPEQMLAPPRRPRPELVAVAAQLLRRVLNAGLWLGLLVAVGLAGAAIAAR